MKIWYQLISKAVSPSIDSWVRSQWSKYRNPKYSHSVLWSPVGLLVQSYRPTQTHGSYNDPTEKIRFSQLFLLVGGRRCGSYAMSQQWAVHGLYKTACWWYCDRHYTTVLQVRPPSHQQLVVFHFSSDVLDSSGVVSMCETRKKSSENCPDAQRPNSFPAPGHPCVRWLSKRGLSTKMHQVCLATENSLKHIWTPRVLQKHVSVVEGNRNSKNQSATGHAFILKKNWNSLKDVESGLVF